jgi:uncharacterized membrane protein
MATANSELMRAARADLTGQWGMAILAFAIYWAISSLGGPVVLIFGGPMMIGLALFSLNLSKSKTAELSLIFDGFKKFGQGFLAYLLITVYVFLWALLLIIPGIIAALSYSQVFYIMVEEEIDATEAMKKSKDLMNGYKWKYFCLNFRFFGWMLLAVLTLGIGFLWLIPYMNVSYAKFYEDIKK